MTYAASQQGRLLDLLYKCLELSYQRTGLLEELCLVELVASQGPLEWGRVLSLLVGPVVHLLETESMGRFCWPNSLGTMQRALQHRW